MLKKFNLTAKKVEIGGNLRKPSERLQQSG